MLQAEQAVLQDELEGLDTFLNNRIGKFAASLSKPKLKSTKIGRPRKLALGDKVKLSKHRLRYTKKHTGHTGVITAFPEPGTNLYQVTCNCDEVRLWTSGQLQLVSRPLREWAP